MNDLVLQARTLWGLFQDILNMSFTLAGTVVCYQMAWSATADYVHVIGLYV